MLGRIWRTRQRIKAVHDYDLETLLRSLNILDALKQGQLHCAVCGASLTLENLQSLFPNGDKVGLCCDKAGCLERVLLLRKEVPGA